MENVTKIEFEPFLLEEIVFLGIRQVELKGDDMSLYNHYREDKDPLYKLPADEHDKAFHELNIKYFSLLGYAEFVYKAIQGFPVFAKEIDKISFLKINKRIERGADIFFHSDDEKDHSAAKTVVFKILPDQFLNIDHLAMDFQKEFLHIHDMLDDEFGYEPSLNVKDANIMRYKLIQDRYTVLWQAYVDARLSARSRNYKCVDILPDMVRVFPDLTKEAVLNILNGLKSKKWTHSGLLGIANN
ncbi:MAG: hypothetical protein ACUZ8H_14835 [Candidatus Anammoxibacter sp.]